MWIYQFRDGPLESRYCVGIVAIYYIVYDLLLLAVEVKCPPLLQGFYTVNKQSSLWVDDPDLLIAKDK